MNKIYVGDVGTVITLDVGEDVSTATTMDIVYKKPDGTTGTWNATLSGTTKIQYTTVSGDIDESGKWYVHAYIVLPSWSGIGETASFEVYEEFE